MKTASGCRSTHGCTPKYRDGFDGAAKMEAGPLKPTLPHSNDEDVRKSLRLNIWPFLSNAAKLRYSEVVHLNCTVAKTRRQSGRASARVFNPSAEIITGPNRSCPLMPQHVGTSCHVGPRVFRQRFGMLIMQYRLRYGSTLKTQPACGLAPSIRPLWRPRLPPGRTPPGSR